LEKNTNLQKVKRKRETIKRDEVIAFENAKERTTGAQVGKVVYVFM
jgi:hypothetical protein